MKIGTCALLSLAVLGSAAPINAQEAANASAQQRPIGPLGLVQGENSGRNTSASVRRAKACFTSRRTPGQNRVSP
jgi:hypothetical protein